MSKYKTYRGPKRNQRKALQGVPCLIVVIAGMALLFTLFLAVLRSN